MFPAAAAPALKESVIASDLSIEGKIEGAGHVRIAGKFKGDVNVKGDLTIEQGAKLNGSVRADKVNVAGELDGSISPVRLGTYLGRSTRRNVAGRRLEQSVRDGNNRWQLHLEE